MVGVEQWAELRREHFVRGVSIKALARRTGLSRNTVRAALRSSEPPSYRRAPAGSKLDPFKDEIHRLLKDEPEMPGQRVRELIEPLGFDGGKTIVDDYLREVRPLFAPPRTYQRTVYRPGEICQFDLWQPRAEIPVGHGQTRQGWVVVACLGYSRAGAGALIFSQADAGVAVRDPALSVVAGRVAADAGLGPPGRVCTPAAGARPSRSPRSAGSSRSAGISAPRAIRRPRAASSACRTSWSARSSPAGCFANELDYQLQLDTWFDERANARIHKTLQSAPDRPADRRARGDGAAAARSRRTPIGAGCCASRPIPICALTPATTRSTRAWSAGASRPG